MAWASAPASCCPRPVEQGQVVGLGRSPATGCRQCSPGVTITSLADGRKLSSLLCGAAPTGAGAVRPVRAVLYPCPRPPVLSGAPRPRAPALQACTVVTTSRAPLVTG